MIGQIHALTDFAFGKEPRSSLNCGLVGLRIRSRRFGEDKIILSLPGFERRIAYLLPGHYPDYVMQASMYNKAIGNNYFN